LQLKHHLQGLQALEYRQCTLLTPTYRQDSQAIFFLKMWQSVAHPVMPMLFVEHKRNNQLRVIFQQPAEGMHQHGLFVQFLKLLGAVSSHAYTAAPSDKHSG